MRYSILIRSIRISKWQGQNNFIEAKKYFFQVWPGQEYHLLNFQ
jgi:hypothetical protein